MSEWFVKYRYNKTQAKIRLFCFPYAGGNATIFEAWKDRLPSSIDIFALQAPGRGARFSEAPITCLKTKVRHIYYQILPFLEIPYIFLGHSNGALTAFELAHALQLSGNTHLKHLVISAKRAPHLAPIKPPMHNLPYDEFVELLREFNSTPSEILENKEMMDFILPMLRADFSLGETYDFQLGRKLNVCTSLYWGNEDEDVPKEDMLAWQQLILQKANLTEFAGGHFFINEQQELYLEKLNALLLEELSLLNDRCLTA